MKVLTPERMAKYDEYAIKTWGIPSAVLMENAGRNTYRLIKERYLSPGQRLAVFCGRGNNGGDGFVIARYALRDGFQVRAFLFCKASELKGDAALNMVLYSSLGGETIELDDDTFPLAEKELALCHVIVDAIFGTGLSKVVEGREARAIDLINGAGKPVMAVDIPSGIDGRTGMAMGTAVRATHTFTYGFPKLGQLFHPGAYHSGKLTVIDISLPPHAETSLGIDGEVVDGGMVRSFLKERMAWAHKGSFGHAAVIAGSPGKTGAAHMASLAALKIGAGLVTLLIPETLNSIMEVKLTEAMTYPVPDEGRGYFLPSAYDAICEFVADKDVIIVGPGLSQEPGTTEVVRRLYTEMKKPFVIDADGINAFAGHLDLIGKAGREAIFTPHPGELARLIGLTPKEINADRIQAGTIFLEKTGANLVLKGARTVVFGAGGGVFVIPSGNQALAKGGSGDILTGFIGGALSQGYSAVEAMILGAYIHGYIADTYVEESTDMDLLAGDLLSGTGRALREIKFGTDRVYIEESL